MFMAFLKLCITRFINISKNKNNSRDRPFLLHPITSLRATQQNALPLSGTRNYHTAAECPRSYAMCNYACRTYGVAIELWAIDMNLPANITVTENVSIHILSFNTCLHVSQLCNTCKTIEHWACTILMVHLNLHFLTLMHMELLCWQVQNSMWKQLATLG